MPCLVGFRHLKVNSWFNFLHCLIRNSAERTDVVVPSLGTNRYWSGEVARRYIAGLALFLKFCFSSCLEHENLVGRMGGTSPTEVKTGRKRSWEGGTCR